MDENVSQKCFFSRAISNPLDLFIGRSRTGLTFPNGPLDKTFGHLDKYIWKTGQIHSANWKNTFWTCSLADQGLVWHFQLAHWASGMQGLEQGDTEAMHSKRIWNKTKMSQVGSEHLSHWTEKKMSGAEDSALICIQSGSANGKREENGGRKKNQQWCIGEHNASTSKASLSLDFLKRMW